jgi:hypothetical protein
MSPLCSVGDKRRRAQAQTDAHACECKRDEVADAEGVAGKDVTVKENSVDAPGHGADYRHNHAHWLSVPGAPVGALTISVAPDCNYPTALVVISGAEHCGSIPAFLGFLNGLLKPHHAGGVSASGGVPRKRSPTLAPAWSLGQLWSAAPQERMSMSRWGTK